MIRGLKHLVAMLSMLFGYLPVLMDIHSSQLCLILLQGIVKMLLVVLLHEGCNSLLEQRPNQICLIRLLWLILYAQHSLHATSF